MYVPSVQEYARLVDRIGNALRSAELMGVVELKKLDSDQLAAAIAAFLSGCDIRLFIERALEEASNGRPGAGNQ